MTFGGIYHKVVKSQGRFELYSLKSWYNFWSHGDQNFKARDNEPLFCFVRIFAPSQFSHRIFLRWQLYDKRLSTYVDQDRIGMTTLLEEEKRGLEDLLTNPIINLASGELS